MKFPNKKYNIIYADPPWSYRSLVNKKMIYKAEDHYNTMTMQDIYDLPVKELADDNCYLFLWIVFPNLPECLEVFKKWGFKYKTIAFNWIKSNSNSNLPFFGIGYYTKSNSEICLLGIKGKPKPVSNAVSSIIIQPKQDHSAKPPVIREKIVELCGDLPRIELFGRQKINGWDCWGNQVEDFEQYKLL